MSVDAYPKDSFACSLRVLLVGDDPDAPGGIATHMRTMRDALTEVDTRLFYVGSPGRDERPFQRAFRRISSPPAFAGALMRWPPDIVHFNPSFDVKALLRDLVLIILARGFRKPVVVQLHGGDTARKFAASKTLQVITRLIFRLAHQVVVLTEQQRGILSEKLPQMAMKISHVPNMVPARPAMDSEQRFGSERYFLWLARLLRPKGIFDLLDALARLHRRGIVCQLIIAGTGPDEEEARNYTVKVGLEGCVHFVGYLSGACKASVLANAVALVLPTYHTEGMPYGVLEAMGYGVPVIACPQEGIADLVDETTGIRVLPKDPEGLSVALERLWSDEALRQRLGTQARCRVDAEFSEERIVAKIMRLYHRAIK